MIKQNERKTSLKEKERKREREREREREGGREREREGGGGGGKHHTHCILSRETCNTGSLVQMRQDVTSRGFPFSCQEDPE